jgi:hypothetical protein
MFLHEAQYNKLLAGKTSVQRFYRAMLARSSINADPDDIDS